METWTHALDEFAHNPIEVVSAVVVIGGAILSMLKAGRLFWSNLWARLRSKPIILSETFRIVQNIQQSFWHLGGANGERLIQVSFRGYITNISGDTNRVLRAEILKPLTYADMVLISNNNDGRRPQILNPNESADLSATFFIKSLQIKKGEPLNISLIFVDQYANRHKISCVFNSM